MGHTTDMTGANTLCYGITGPKRLLAGRLLERHSLHAKTSFAQRNRSFAGVIRPCAPQDACDVDHMCP
jgi:hypothetical protein